MGKRSLPVLMFQPMSDDARFPFLSVDAPEPRAESLGALLFELGASGVEVRDETTLVKGAGPGQVTLVASFATRAAAVAAQRQLLAREPGLRSEVGELVGDAWRDKYKEHFRPFALTDSITVVPPWVEHPEEPGRRQLSMDPGRAFGTGLHATTSLVARALEHHRDRFAARRVLDVGCGSGILALVALLLGAASARAVDNDPEVIGVARENAERNELAERIVIDTLPLERIDERFVLVVANIEARTLCALASMLADHVEPGGLLILSGVLASQCDEVLAVFGARPGGVSLAHLATDVQPEPSGGDDAWVAITLQRLG